jgi:hypothetical protein
MNGGWGLVGQTGHGDMETNLMSRLSLYQLSDGYAR